VEWPHNASTRNRLWITSGPAARPLSDEPFSPGALEPSGQNAAQYLDCNRSDPGILHAGDPAVRVFADRGWRWGGYWRTPIDYQHFER